MNTYQEHVPPGRRWAPWSAMATALLALAVGAALLPPPVASAVITPDQQVAIRDEAAKYGLTVRFYSGACGGHSACWTPGPNNIIDVNTDKTYPTSTWLDFVRHEAAHYRITNICGTVNPPLVDGSHKHNGNKSYEGNFEFVADAYALQYHGMSYANAWYLADSAVTAAERNTFMSWATRIYNGDCGQKVNWIDANGDGIPDDWGTSKTSTDMNGDGKPDIVGFSSTVRVSYNKTSYFSAPESWSTPTSLGPKMGSGWSTPEYWWTYEYPRIVVDLNKDGRADIVAFGRLVTEIYYTKPGGGFSVGYVSQFSQAQGWQAGRHPRMVVDVNNDGYPDIVGFFDDGVYVSLNQGGTGFAPSKRWTTDFGYLSAGWRVDMHPRMLVDVNKDGFPDIVGFATDGVVVALNQCKAGKAQFAPYQWWRSGQFGSGTSAGGWRVDMHPRMLVDVNKDGFPDIVGFAGDGVVVALNQWNAGKAQFAPFQWWTHDFSYNAAGWRVSMHPRMLADMNKDGFPDIVGFASDGVVVALNQWNAGKAQFAPYQWWTHDFSYNAAGWRVSMHPRMLVDVNKDGFPDIVGFASDGVVVALNQWNAGKAQFAPYQWWLKDQFGSSNTAGQWRVMQNPRMIG